MQAAVGTLLAKTLTTSTTNPYVGNPSSSYSTPAALDVFSVQVRAYRLERRTGRWKRLTAVQHSRRLIELTSTANGYPLSRMF